MNKLIRFGIISLVLSFVIGCTGMTPYSKFSEENIINKKGQQEVVAIDFEVEDEEQ